MNDHNHSRDDDFDLDEPKSFLEHLEDLRTTVFRVALALVIGIGIAVPLVPWMVGAITRPLYRADLDTDIEISKLLQFLDITDGVALWMKGAFWGGMILATPFIIYFIGQFVFPGLTRRERRTVLIASGFATILFALGVCMGYFVTLEVAIQLMFRINQRLGFDVRLIRAVGFVGFVLKLLLAFGLAFELPVVVMALGQLGLVSSRQLREKRRHVMVGLLILAMVLTPPDPVTQLMMAVPMACLYEICIWMIWLKEKRDAKALE